MSSRERGSDGWRGLLARLPSWRDGGDGDGSGREVALALEGMTFVAAMMVDEGSPAQIGRPWFVGEAVRVVFGGIRVHPILLLQGGLERHL